MCVLRLRPARRTAGADASRSASARTYHKSSTSPRRIAEGTPRRRRHKSAAASAPRRFRGRNRRPRRCRYACDAPSGTRAPPAGTIAESVAEVNVAQCRRNVGAISARSRRDLGACMYRTPSSVASQPKCVWPKMCMSCGREASPPLVMTACSAHSGYFRRFTYRLEPLDSSSEKVRSYGLR